MNRLLFATVVCWILSSTQVLWSGETFRADLIVYGNTSSGVIAAVQAKRMGKSVLLVGPDMHLGGLSSGGLGFTDTGNKAVIGGLARDFYHRIWKEYQKPSTWRWQPQSAYGNKGQGTPAIDGENRTMWIFEPHVAERVFEMLVEEYQITVHRDQWLDRDKGVKKADGRIVSITMHSGNSYEGKMFIDATYEGDLMAASGVRYHVGREANSVYGEKWNGVQVGVLHHKHHFGVLQSHVSPYRIANDPKSGLLPKVSDKEPGSYGSGDRRIQAYCYRMCLTNHPENRIDFPKPEGYDPKDYELLLRVYDAGWNETFEKFDPIPNLKTDTNNHGPFSTDNIGMNYDYPDASYERRREILDEHRRYQQGWLYFITNDPRIPERVQSEMRKWGLPIDEFVDNQHWPHQIYVREARRMIGRFVMTENELMKRRETPESVGMGSYTIDSHNVQRYVTPEGYVQNEGDIGVGIKPYRIALGCLQPKPGECDNLLVSVCVSSSHIAFGSIRMEPVFMILGQSAATVAALAIDKQMAVQDVPYDLLRERLLADGQVLEHSSEGKLGETNEPLRPQDLPGVVVDDEDAELTGTWTVSHSSQGFVGSGYRHDGAAKDGKASAIYKSKLSSSGRYEILLSYTPNPNRSSKVKVDIKTTRGIRTIMINQRKDPPIEKRFISLGLFDLTAEESSEVHISNEGSDGYVVIDAVQWLIRN